MQIKKFILICLLVLLSFDSGFALRKVREGNIIAFYNNKNFKVKAYYTVNNKVIYVFRYYYNDKNSCVRKETWKKNRLISYYIFKYYPDKRLKIKKYFFKSKLRLRIKYDRNGDIIEKKVFPKKKVKSHDKKEKKHNKKDAPKPDKTKVKKANDENKKVKKASDKNKKVKKANDESKEIKNNAHLRDKKNIKR